MRKVVTSLSISLDGFISGENGNYSWIAGDNSGINGNINGKYNFNSLIKDIEVIIMGKNCFVENMADEFKNFKVIVVTNELIKDFENYIFLGPENTIKYVEKSLENIFIFGGGITLKPFIENNMIDEYQIGIVQTILGKGRKLFFDMDTEIKLEMTSLNVENGITILNYKKRA